MIRLYKALMNPWKISKKNIWHWLKLKILEDTWKNYFQNFLYLYKQSKKPGL